MSWEVIRTEHLSHDLLAALFNNEIGALLIPRFVSTDICKRAVQAIQAHGIDHYRAIYAQDVTKPKIGRIGITQFEHRDNPSKKLEYFAKVPEANATRKRILKDSGDLLYTVIDFIKSAWGKDADIAFEDSLDESYFAGVIRVTKMAFLHLDWAPRDAPDWTIGKISAQLTWNLFLQVGSAGGATLIYQRLWKEADEAHKLPESAEYDASLVEGCSSVRIFPEEGGISIFNSRNYHAVERTEGELERISLSSFFGLVEPTGSLIFWS